MSQVRFRFQLRLAFLLITLLCTSIAWLKYRAMTSHYDGLVHRYNTTTRLAIVESRIEAAKRLLNAKDPSRTRDMQSRLSFALQQKEAEKAMCELELKGFQVSWPNRRRPEPEVTVGSRFLTDEEVRQLLGHLKTIGRCHLEMIVDLERARRSVTDQVVRDLQNTCPTCKVKR